MSDGYYTCVHGPNDQADHTCGDQARPLSGHLKVCYCLDIRIPFSGYRIDFPYNFDVFQNTRFLKIFCRHVLQNKNEVLRRTQ